MRIIDHSFEEQDLFYAWVLGSGDGVWRVTDWDGNAREIEASEFYARPDQEHIGGGRRQPVVRTIGTGQRAEYYRFERKQ